LVATSEANSSRDRWRLFHHDLRVIVGFKLVVLVERRRATIGQDEKTLT
jgi:hypothetical protein